MPAKEPSRAVKRNAGQAMGRRVGLICPPLSHHRTLRARVAAPSILACQPFVVWAVEAKTRSHTAHA